MRTTTSSLRRLTSWCGLVLLLAAQVALAAGPCLQALQASAGSASSHCPLPDSDCCVAQCIQGAERPAQPATGAPSNPWPPAALPSPVRIIALHPNTAPSIRIERFVPPAPPIPIRNCSLLQ